MQGIKKFFNKFALYLVSLPFFRRMYSVQVQEQLRILNPTKDKQELTKTYYGEKLSLVFMVFFFGVILLIVVFSEESGSGILLEENRLSRGDYGTDSKVVTLKVVAEEEALPESIISYEVSSRHYSAEEISDYIEKFETECEALILGENESVNQVSYDLQLASTYEGYPMEFEWESGDYSVLDEDGTVYNAALTEPVTVELTAIITYGEQEFEHSFSLRVCPKEYTFQEKWQQALESAIQKADEEQKYTGELVLPGEIAGTNVTYTLGEKENPVVYIAFLILASALLFFGKDNDLKKEVEKRKQEMSLVYPEFISKFLILSGAGMSIRNIFYRLSEDNSLGIYLQRELQLLVRDLNNGVLEKDALDRFGKRSGNALYIKFCALIIQNLKKGTGDLLILLKSESEEAFLLRKNHAKQLGEEAGTKLLAPMMIMLAIVMVLIMIPALLSFQF